MNFVAGTYPSIYPDLHTERMEWNDRAAKPDAKTFMYFCDFTSGVIIPSVTEPAYFPPRTGGACGVYSLHWQC